MVNLTNIKQRIKTQSNIYITIPCKYVRKQTKRIQRIIHRWHNIKQNKKISSIESEYNRGKRECLLGKGGASTQWAWGGVLTTFLTGCGYVAVQLLICFLNHSCMFYAFFLVIISSVQSLSCVLLFGHHGMQHASPSCPSWTPRAYSNSCPSSQWCHPTISSSVIPFSSCLQSFPASGSCNESVLCIRWPKYWSYSFSIRPSNDYSGLISFRMDRLDLLAVQVTLKSLLQHHSSKASILECWAFFIVQLSHTYMTTGKTIALTRQTFVGKVISLLFNMPSRLVIAFLPRSKRLLIVTICSDFGAPKNKVCHCFPIYLPWSDGTRCHDLSFLNVEF